MKKLIYTLIILLLPITLTGCDNRIAKLYLSEIYCSLPFTCSGKDRVGLDLRGENYTGYEIDNYSVHELDDKDMSSGGYGAVSWKKTQKPPVTIKVWWRLDYDENKHQNDTTYNRQLEKRSSNGTVWCEAIVKIKEPYPAYDVSHLYLYFFPDGHVEAELGGLVVDTQDPYRRMKDTEREYTDAQKAAFPRRHDGKYCDRYIDNPWFGVDTSNPWK
jgi:uncharacterized lipoprotein NlpE involved in copper resistance